MTTGREREKLLTAPETPGGIKYTTTPPDDGPPSTFVNARTGVISQVPAGIDAGWANNPGLNRARTLTTRFNQRLAEAGQDDARAAIADLWKTPAPKIFAGLPQTERVQIPAAIAPKLADALDAESALVTVSRDTLANKTAATRAPADGRLESFGQVQDLLDAGTVVDRGQPNRRSVVTERDDGWWSTTVARSAAGFLRIVSVTRVRAERAQAWLKGSG